MKTPSSTLAWRIPMDRGAWRATVRGVTKSCAQLSDHAQHSTAQVLVTVLAGICDLFISSPCSCPDPHSCAGAWGSGQEDPGSGS